jgi:hypothetical protein
MKVILPLGVQVPWDLWWEAFPEKMQELLSREAYEQVRVWRGWERWARLTVTLTGSLSSG